MRIRVKTIHNDFDLTPRRKICRGCGISTHEKDQDFSYKSLRISEKDKIKLVLPTLKMYSTGEYSKYYLIAPYNDPYANRFVMMSTKCAGCVGNEWRKEQKSLKGKIKFWTD